jgi:hypothetical protein
MLFHMEKCPFTGSLKGKKMHFKRFSEESIKK